MLRMLLYVDVDNKLSTEKITQHRYMLIDWLVVFIRSVTEYTKN